MIVRAYHAVLTLPIAQLYAAGGPVSKVFAGPRSSYAVCDSSSASLGYTAGAFAWGSREFGSLGDSSVSATHAYEPVRLDAFADEATTGRLAKASSSLTYTCFLTTHGYERGGAVEELVLLALCWCSGCCVLR